MTLWHISHFSQFCIIANLLRVHPAPSSRSLIKMLNRIGPLGYTDSYWPPTRLHETDHHLLGPAIQPFFNPPQSLLIQHIIQQLLYVYFMRNNIKSLAVVQVVNIHCSPLIYQASHFIIEGYQVGQVWLPFGEDMLTTPDDFLVLMCLEMVSRTVPSPFKGLRWDWLVCISLSHASCPSWILKWYLLFYSLWALLLISMTEQRSLRVTSQRQLPAPSALGCVPPGPMDLYTSILFKQSMTWSSSTKGTSSLLQPFLLVSGIWNSWRLVLVVKTEAKKTFSISCPV